MEIDCGSVGVTMVEQSLLTCAGGEAPLATLIVSTLVKTQYLFLTQEYMKLLMEPKTSGDHQTGFPCKAIDAENGDGNGDEDEEDDGDGDGDGDGKEDISYEDGNPGGNKNGPDKEENVDEEDDQDDDDDEADEDDNDDEDEDEGAGNEEEDEEEVVEEEEEEEEETLQPPKKRKK
ncbi:Hypothetical predicted protein [Olea europaea subsp. europaea]|uniref:Uncharacterized protein n=1 Tax=Olea europaea subsp. europaea TaxID=158383 RepID=A0A8S0SLE0_OLEEU|nr:Hypothetical predicted protein [Olea europaea subsp. europaea]